MEINEKLLQSVIDRIESISGKSIFKMSRKPKTLVTRIYFCWVLKNKYELNDRQISELFLARGVVYNRSSIFMALKKFDQYLKNFEFMRNLHVEYTRSNIVNKMELLDIINQSSHLKDDEMVSLVKKKLRIRDFKERVKKKVNRELSQTEKDIATALAGLSYEQEEEVLAMVRMKVKSFNWKSKDVIKVYTGSGTIDAF